MHHIKLVPFNQLWLIFVEVLWLFSVQAEKGGLRMSRNSLSTVSLFTLKVCVKARRRSKLQNAEDDAKIFKMKLKFDHKNETPPKPVPSPVVKGGGVATSGI
ncbi:Structural maintenance of chromosomes-like protein [Trichinella pseudospiralis]